MASRFDGGWRRITLLLLGLLGACARDFGTPPTDSEAFLQGRVVEVRGGAPVGVVGADVAIPGTNLFGRTGEDGFFLLGPLPPNALRVSAAFGNRKRLSRLVMPRRRTTQDVGDVVLGPPGTLTGRVLLEGRTSHEGSLVFVPGQTPFTLTRPDGSFRLEGIVAGEAQLAATRDGFAPATRGPVELAAGTIVALDEFTLAAQAEGAPPGSLEGSVQLLGAPAGTVAEVVLSSSRSTQRATVGADGRFRFTALQPGAWDVVASAPGLASASLPNQVVFSGAATQVGTLTLAVPDPRSSTGGTGGSTTTTSTNTTSGSSSSGATGTGSTTAGSSGSASSGGSGSTGGCRTNADCPAPNGQAGFLVCASGTCERCSGSDDTRCGPLLCLANEGRCIQTACERDSDCPSKRVCSGGSCTACIPGDDPRRTPSTRCDASAGLACSPSAFCEAAQCFFAADCANRRLACVAPGTASVCGVCGPGSPCRAGQTCDRDVCIESPATSSSTTSSSTTGSTTTGSSGTTSSSTSSTSTSSSSSTSATSSTSSTSTSSTSTSSTTTSSTGTSSTTSSTTGSGTTGSVGSGTTGTSSTTSVVLTTGSSGTSGTSGTSGSACPGGCIPPTPICLSGENRCVECGGSQECLSGSPQRPDCDLVSHTCKACTSDLTCRNASAATPYCSNNACVGCRTTDDCPRSGQDTHQVCSALIRSCVACTNDAECGPGKACTYSGLCRTQEAGELAVAAISAPFNEPSGPEAKYGSALIRSHGADLFTAIPTDTGAGLVRLRIVRYGPVTTNSSPMTIGSVDQAMPSGITPPPVLVQGVAPDGGETLTFIVAVSGTEVATVAGDFSAVLTPDPGLTGGFGAGVFRGTSAFARLGSAGAFSRIRVYPPGLPNGLLLQAPVSTHGTFRGSPLFGNGWVGAISEKGLTVFNSDDGGLAMPLPFNPYVSADATRTGLAVVTTALQGPAGGPDLATDLVAYQAAAGGPSNPMPDLVVLSVPPGGTGVQSVRRTIGPPFESIEVATVPVPYSPLWDSEGRVVVSTGERALRFDPKGGGQEEGGVQSFVPNPVAQAPFVADASGLYWTTSTSANELFAFTLFSSRPVLSAHADRVVLGNTGAAPHFMADMPPVVLSDGRVVAWVEFSDHTPRRLVWFDGPTPNPTARGSVDPARPAIGGTWEGQNRADPQPLCDRQSCSPPLACGMGFCIAN